MKPYSERTNNTASEGEVSGLYLQALFAACPHHCLLDLRESGLEEAELDPQGWYPFQQLLNLLSDFRRSFPQSHSLLFEIGSAFAQLSFHQPLFLGQSISTSRDWLYLHEKGESYRSVIRGPKELVGWCRMLSIDEKQGIAVYEDVSPFRGEFVRGIFYGGFIPLNDLDYYHVDVKSSPYPGSDYLFYNEIRVNFRFRPQSVDLDRLEAIENGKLSSCEITPDELNSLLLRQQLQREYMEHERAFFIATSRLLEQAVSMIEQQRDDLEQIAYRDNLTGLPTLRVIEQHFARITNAAKRNLHQITVLFCDLDRFKEINDTHGHAVGDAVLKEVAQRITHQLRPTDLASRIGGDEFIIVLDRIQYPEDASAIISRIREAVTSPFYCQEQNLYPGISIGHASFPNDGRDLKTLLVVADHRMYLDKQANKPVPH